MVKAAILTDVTRCVGCQACASACKEINGLPRDGEAHLSATTWCVVEQHGDVHVKRQCMHCLDPACVTVCPVGALHKTPEGPVVYDESRCMGCRYCMIGCPFGVPKYEWTNPLPRVQKCILCYEKRVQAGQEPACTSVCPTKAITFGDRDELVAEAQRRIREAPDRYVDHIYGLQEAGGTSVLYLSSTPFSNLGFKDGMRQDAYPRLTWEVLSKIPNIVSVGAVALFGIWWISSRRDVLKQVEEGEITLEEAMRRKPPLFDKKTGEAQDGGDNHD